MSVRAPSRTKSRSSRASRNAGLIGAAFLCGWALYAVPTARAKTEAALRPLLGAVLPAAREIRIGQTHARRGELNGQTVLYVEGALVNTGGHKLKSPTLRIALMGEDGRPVYTWKAKPTKAEMAANGETPFQTRLLAPPESFRSIAISVEHEG